MMRHILILLLVSTLTVPVGASTAQELIDMLRIRVGEPTEATSFFTDAQALTWITLAQDRIGRLGKYAEYESDITYVADTTHYIPAGYFYTSIRQVFVHNNNDWLDITSKTSRYFSSSGHATEGMNIILSSDGMVPQYAAQVITAGDKTYQLTGARSIHSVIYVDANRGIYYPVLPLDSPDTTSQAFRYNFHRGTKTGNLNDGYLDLIAPDGFVETSRYWLYDEDDKSFGLPLSFRRLLGAQVFSGEDWQPMVYNQNFAKDTTGYQFSINWTFCGPQGSGSGPRDSAVVYIKGDNFIDGDTVKIFFSGATRDGSAIGTNDSLKISYYSMPDAGDKIKIVGTRMTPTISTLLSNIYLRRDVEVDIVEEAMRYYNEARQQDEKGMAIGQQLRQDIGIDKGTQQ